MLCKPRAEVLMQKHQKHIWECLQLAQARAQKHISIILCPSYQQSPQYRDTLAKDAVLAVGRAEEEAGGSIFHCLC